MSVFLYRGFTMEFLKLSGKTPSEKDRLTMLVIGRISEGKQDLSRLVTITNDDQWQVYHKNNI